MKDKKGTPPKLHGKLSTAPAEKATLPAADDKPSSALRIPLDERKTPHRQMADASVSPTINGAFSTKTWAEKGFGEIGLNETVEVLEERVRAVVANDLDFAKGMLIAQASALDAIFNEVGRRAATCLNDQKTNITSLDGLMRVAFKAQGQCRATLQTLGELVNPRSVAFIKQTNMANGPQQVNNGQAPAPGQSPSHAHEENRKRANELLGVADGERLDQGAATEAGGIGPWLATVDAIHRAKVGTGEGAGGPERAQARAAVSPGD